MCVGVYTHPAPVARIYTDAMRQCLGEDRVRIIDGTDFIAGYIKQVGKVRAK